MKSKGYSGEVTICDQKIGNIQGWELSASDGKEYKDITVPTVASGSYELGCSRRSIRRLHRKFAKENQGKPVTMTFVTDGADYQGDVVFIKRGLIKRIIDRVFRKSKPVDFRGVGSLKKVEKEQGGGLGR
jgi:hypothetical protein